MAHHRLPVEIGVARMKAIAATTVIAAAGAIEVFSPKTQ